MLREARPPTSFHTFCFACLHKRNQLQTCQSYSDKYANTLVDQEQYTENTVGSPRAHKRLIVQSRFVKHSGRKKEPLSAMPSCRTLLFVVITASCFKDNGNVIKGTFMLCQSTYTQQFRTISLTFMKAKVAAK